MYLNVGLKKNFFGCASQNVVGPRPCRPTPDSAAVPMAGAQESTPVHDHLSASAQKTQLSLTHAARVLPATRGNVEGRIA